MVAASLVQSHGAGQGALLDPASLQPLIGGSAGARALEVVRAMAIVTAQPPPSGSSGNQSCGWAAQEALNGRCLMTLADASWFKVCELP